MSRSVFPALALALLLLCAASLSALAQPQGKLTNCPPPGMWSLAVWSGDNNMPTGDALATCSGVTVDAAYWLDPQTQAWLRYFRALPQFDQPPHARPHRTRLVCQEAVREVGQRSLPTVARASCRLRDFLA